MASRQPREIGPDELRLLARIVGVEIPADRLERLAEQVSTVFQSIDKLDVSELQGIEPATSFSLPWQ